MFSTTVYLALLFIAGLLSTLFQSPIYKILASLLQYFFPSTSITASSETTSKKERSNGDVDRGFKKEELRKVFATFDKNGDGFVTTQELRESLSNIGISMADDAIRDTVVKFDSNGDGLIDFDEFCLLIAEYMGTRGHGEKESEERSGEAEEEEENLMEAFGVFDRDKDGLISEEELALVLTSLGLREGKKMEDCREMIKKVDKDGDGMVDFHEFKAMMKARKLVLAS